MTSTDLAISVFFQVTIDGQDLGAFTSCEGLSFEIDVESREEGGNNGFVHQLPGRIRYQNITLTRPINADSQKLANWFATMRGRIRRTNAVIAALTSDGREQIASWSLEGVIPVRWSGPTLSAEDVRVATETFEIAHHGFLGRS
jgi:phage tail-like protein